jgi:hypothetical protein
MTIGDGPITYNNLNMPSGDGPIACNSLHNMTIGDGPIMYNSLNMPSDDGPIAYSSFIFGSSDSLLLISLHFYGFLCI